MDDDDAEERAMEVEALESIFLEDLEVVDATTLRLTLEPETDEEAHVGATIEIRTDAAYPSSSRPHFAIASSRGLAKTHVAELQRLAEATAAETPGAVCVFDVATALKDWLGEHNAPGQDDDSMYAAMLRRQEERGDGAADRGEETALEREEREREERLRTGTPFSVDRFHAWNAEFLREHRQGTQREASDDGGLSEKRKLTGKELFRKGAAGAVADEDRPDGDDDDDDDATRSPGVDATLFEDEVDVDDVDLDDDDDDDDVDDDV